MARRGRRAADSIQPARDVDYRNLKNPFPTMDVFSADEIASMHDTALRTLEELGVRVLLPEARDILVAGGARLDGDIVYIGRDMVAAALETAPKSITCRAGGAGPRCNFGAWKPCVSTGGRCAPCDRPGAGTASGDGAGLSRVDAANAAFRRLSDGAAIGRAAGCADASEALFHHGGAVDVERQVSLRLFARDAAGAGKL